MTGSIMKESLLKCRLAGSLVLKIVFPEKSALTDGKWNMSVFPDKHLVEDITTTLITRPALLEKESAESLKMLISNI